jgi:peptide/nickel transport system substrate-binding protein
LLKGVVQANNVRAIDDYTVEFRLDFPYAPFLATLPWLYIVNEKQLRANEKSGDYGKDWLRTHDAGSGPFTIESYQGGQKIVYRRYPDYWRGWGSKYLDGWVYQVVDQSSTLRLRLERDDLDFTDYLTVDDWTAVKSNPNIVARADPLPGMIAVKFNCQKAPTSNLYLRRALAYAYDYDAVVTGLLHGYAGRMYSPIPPNVHGYKSFKGDPVLDYSTNMEKARAALSQSGLNPQEIHLLYNYVGADTSQRDLGLVLKSSAEKLGIDVQVEGLPATVYLDRLTAPATCAHANRVGMSGDPDPDTHLYAQFDSHSWKPTGAWYSCNFVAEPRLDDLLERARSTVDWGFREPLYEQAQRVVLELCPSAFVHTRDWFVAQQNYVKGYEFIGAGYDSTYVYPMYKDKPHR